jgi:hypothetical protein
MLSNGGLIVLKTNFNSLKLIKLVDNFITVFIYVIRNKQAFYIKIYLDVRDSDVRDGCTEPC